MTGLPADLLRILRCPVCRGELNEIREPHELHCVECGRRYPVDDGIPGLAPDLAKEE